MIIRDFFFDYWKNNDTMVDYLIVDYLIVLAQKHDLEYKRNFKKYSLIIPNVMNYIKLWGNHLIRNSGII